jgi:hypothetical protein
MELHASLIYPCPRPKIIENFTFQAPQLTLPNSQYNHHVNSTTSQQTHKKCDLLSSLKFKVQQQFTTVQSYVIRWLEIQHTSYEIMNGV